MKGSHPLARWTVATATAMLLGIAAHGAPIVTSGSDDGVRNDIFDVSQLSVVLGSSPMLACCGGSLPENTFGGMAGVEPPHTLFLDGPPPDSIDFINFQTATPVALTGYLAILADDSDNPANPGDPNRGSSSFSLFTSPDNTFSSPTLISTTQLPPSYAANFGSNAIQITDSFAPVTAQFFRLEVTRTTGGGPRIRELDGIGSPVPEPASATLLTLGAAGCFSRRSRARANSEQSRKIL